MRTLSIVFTLAAIVACPRCAVAQQQTTDQKEGGVEMIVERICDLSLTDDQEMKIESVRKDFRPKIGDAAKELAGVVKEEVDKVRDVLTPEQRDKIKALEDRNENRREHLAARLAHLKDLHLSDAEKAQFEEIREQYKPKVEKLVTDMGAVLSDEQKTTRKEGLKAGKTRREIRDSLNLTNDQKEKLESIGKDLVGVVRDELDKMKSVLTSSQQEQIAEFRSERRDQARDRLACAISNFGDLDLTAEQKSKIKSIREEYRPKVHEAGNKLRSLARDEVSQILDIVKG
jgi:Spy/CpxP family protein refolding chaperone